MSELRWVLQLECGHNLLDDSRWEEGNASESHEHCPACGFSVRVTGCFSYRDDDV